MKSLIKFYVELFTDAESFWDRLLAILVTGLSLFCLCLVLKFTYDLTDYRIGKPFHDKTATIVGGYFRPAHIVSTGKSVFWVSDEWHICATIDERPVNFTVSRNFYDSVNIGNILTVDGIEGRFTGYYYVKVIKEVR